MWATLNGYKVNDGRGRVANEVIDAYNADKANRRARRQYVAGAAPADTTTFHFTTAAGRESTYEGVPSEVRAWGVEQGLCKPTRGRLPQSVIDAYGQQVAKPPRKRKAKASA